MTEAGNFRPVALTSIPCNMVEVIIKNNVISHIEENDFFTPHQHGFTRKKSCLTNLLETLEDWTASLEEGYGVNVLYLDYQKVFDTVPDKRLMKKLK
jgi:Reverse transcriptase (RNA-dependent DNA polymerase)